MNSDEKKRVISLSAVGAVLIVAVSVAANLAQILDWLGIRPNEDKYKKDPSTTVETVIPETTTHPETVIHDETNDTEYIETDPIAPPEDYEPKVVKLTDLDYFNSEHALSIAIVDDNLGETHGRVLSTRTSYVNGYSQYYLNKQYCTLSGTAFLEYSSRSTKYEIQISFYGDGNELGSYSFTGGVFPQNFEFDVSDVEMLEISYNDWSNEIVGIDATLTKAE